MSEPTVSESMSGSSPLLSLDGVCTNYGKISILRDVSLTVGAGEVVALLGLNGAGKTTTMRSILGLTPPRSGTVRFDGRDVTGWPPYKIARLGVGYVPEGRRMFKELTTLENLQLAEQGRAGDWTIPRVLETLPKLAELRARKAGRLSGGEQEMLAIGRALVANPRLILVDEPSQGLAPLVVEDVYRILTELKQTGVAVLLVEQNALLALRIADRAYVLDSGRVVHAGPAAELAADRDRIRTLMGLEVSPR
ncbi:MAG: branched-chain amino acid transport system ATP-binding protein [Candidatus Eremiobacteraeota bacterium]|jgi:branched-chain amino acid transport system ATP-binding protein|nr:branched-chain amino acid transport system ATP-binding protein [Candidatus Eremiobacteraeota bacterium]